MEEILLIYQVMTHPMALKGSSKFQNTKHKTNPSKDRWMPSFAGINYQGKKSEGCLKDVANDGMNYQCLNIFCRTL